MERPMIEVLGVSKKYRLGSLGARSLREEVENFWLRWRQTPRGANGATAPAGAPPDSTAFWALREVSFSVPRGQVLGIIGRNGAGKSTLLKILSRITRPTHGEVLMRGRLASLLEVGTGFHPELSGRENIFLNGAILGMVRSEIARKFDEIVAFSEVEQFIDTPVKRYSSGMYVRLAFAVAAHLEPEILILDEVLAVGDARFQSKCLAKIQEVSREHGRTILLVTHSMDSVLRLCQRAVLLDGGRIVAEGTPPEVVPRYFGPESSVLIPGEVRQLAGYPRSLRPGAARFADFVCRVVGEGDRGYVYRGCSLEFTVGIDAQTALTLGGLALYFETEAEHKLLNFDIQRFAETAQLQRGRNEWVIRTGPLPLNPITLRASLWMVDSDKMHIVDEVRAFGRLEFLERTDGALGKTWCGDSVFVAEYGFTLAEASQAARTIAA